MSIQNKEFEGPTEGALPIDPGSTSLNSINGDTIAQCAEQLGDPQLGNLVNDAIQDANRGKLEGPVQNILGPHWASVLQRIADLNAQKMSDIEESQYLRDFFNAQTSINCHRAQAITSAREIFTTSQDNPNNFLTNFAIPHINRDIRDSTVNITTFLERIRQNLNSVNDIYETTQINVTSLNNILEMKEKVLFDTIANIQLYEEKNNVDVRKNLYEFERITLYNSVFNTLKIIYFALFIIYIIFGNFMKNKMYKNPYFYIVAVFYIVFPFILKYIFAGIIFVYEYILSLMGKNKQILSYPDIVRASNIDNIYTNPVPNRNDYIDVINAYRTFVENPSNQDLPFIRSTVQNIL